MAGNEDIAKANDIPKYIVQRSQAAKSNQQISYADISSNTMNSGQPYSDTLKNYATKVARLDLYLGDVIVIS